MSALRHFVADLLEAEDAVVDSVGDECLDVLAPEPVRTAFGWQTELVRLGFGPTRPTGAIPVGLEGDWLNRFGTLLGTRGQTGMRQLARPDAPSPNAPERLIEKALELPNAVWRLAGRRQTWTQCLLLAFRYTATSDEKREGVIWLGFNLGTGAVLDPTLLARLGEHMADPTPWSMPEPAALAVAETGIADTASLTGRIPALLEHRVRAELDTFLRSMRRRLDRDRKRVHAYHDDLRQTAQTKLGKVRTGSTGKAEADGRRETLRIEAIEREYAAKIEDLKHKYALQIQAEWVQGLVLLVPVERYEIMIKRRKGERIVAMDWHSGVRQMETPLDEAGLGVGHVRLVCDERLHLTTIAGQTCPACAKDRCHACHPTACPRCKR
jgi:hypothetical protein